MRRVLLSLAPLAWIVSLLLTATAAAPAANARAAAGAAAPARAPLFRTSETCLACHNQLVTPSGEDVSIAAEWRASMMANSARDPYWQASVRREVMDRPALRAAIEDECATCHMPMARVHARAAGRTGEVFAHLPVGRAAATPDAALAADGVSCTLCHQITPEKLGTPDSFTGGFTIDRARPGAARAIFGPFAIDRGRTTIMRSATGFVPTESAHVQQSELCATCHTLHTDARGEDGGTIARLPEQVPYQEWQHSAFRGQRSCQACHMPAAGEATPIAAVLGEPRDGLSRHLFRGGNFFVLEMLDRYRDELGVTAPSNELRAAARAAVAHLQTETARVSIADGRVQGSGHVSFEVVLENLAGHKLPTGYPSRRAWLHVIVRDRDGRAVFESGAIQPDGRIVGNDNDADGSTFEPHYVEIRRADEVQIYESTMVDVRGRVTTGLLSGVRFVKDNRLLPRGFEKPTAGPDIAVHGAAATDSDFGPAGGDRVRYLVETGGASGPLRVEAELWFQPIAYRWAENLRAYDAAEPRRFVRYFEAMAGSSGIVMARAHQTLP